MRGWVRVAPFNDPRDSLLLRLPAWFLRSPRGQAQGDDGLRAVEVECARAHGAGEIVARIVGVDDRDAALALEGVEVLLARDRFPEPPAGEVYRTDLIGCAVVDPDGESLGTVVAVEDHPAHPVMRLSGAGRARLVPFVPELIRSVDLVARVVVADWRRDW
ncbi:MAG: ribosome maturation factor RimM [Burkholderiaceae bacterium]|nr:ribosome maturation factor RimM [Burkholderiaceae bacterium]